MPQGTQHATHLCCRQHLEANLSQAHPFSAPSSLSTANHRGDSCSALYAVVSSSCMHTHAPARSRFSTTNLSSPPAPPQSSILHLARSNPACAGDPVPQTHPATLHNYLQLVGRDLHRRASIPVVKWFRPTPATTSQGAAGKVWQAFDMRSQAEVNRHS